MVSWIVESFSVADYVVLKLDVEGAEDEIVPRLLASNASKLIDVFLWECHARKEGLGGRCKCAAWEAALIASGVKHVYRDPYLEFAPSSAPSWRSGTA